MTVYEELRKWFSTGIKKGGWKIESLPDEYPAYVVKDYYGYGVVIELPNKKILVNESFSNCTFNTEIINSGDRDINRLFFLCRDFDFYIEFASICAQLVEPGENGKDRKKLLKDPLSWWKNWKLLIGNSTFTKNVYSIIAELMVLEHLYKNDKNVEWIGAKAGSVDIENEDNGYEVKSTIKKQGYTFTASSEFQLSTTKYKTLKLFFCRMEKSSSGNSINQMVKKLVDLGYNKKDLEDDLKRLGLPYGNSSRNEKFSIIEKRMYPVTEDFPRIVPESFKNDVIPNGITHIVYNVDLGAVKNYTSW